MDILGDKALGTFYASGVAAASGGLTVTAASASGVVYIAKHVSGSGDAAALVTIESPASTVIWRKRFAAAFNFTENFTEPIVQGASSAAILAKISANTTNAELQIGGYKING